MKALVTGSTGFVGSHLVRALTEAGHSAVALHRASSRLDGLAGLTYESALGDVTDLDSLRSACEGCDWVFHVAAVADYWRADVNRMYDVNVDGTKKVLDAARETGVKRVIFTSSAAAVGVSRNSQPADESVYFDLPPERFPYAHSKALAEDLVRDAVEDGQDVVITNPVVILGPGDLNLISGDIVLQVHRLSWTIPVPPGGIALIDVRDVAKLHIAAAERGRTGERYILGESNAKHQTVFLEAARLAGVAAPGIPLPRILLEPAAEIIETLRAFDVPIPVDGNQVRLGGRDVYFDFSKTARELGTAEIGWKQSMRDTWDWYLANGYVKDDGMSRLIQMIGKLF